MGPTAPLWFLIRLWRWVLRLHGTLWVILFLLFPFELCAQLRRIPARCRIVQPIGIGHSIHEREDAHFERGFPYLLIGPPHVTHGLHVGITGMGRIEREEFYECEQGEILLAERDALEVIGADGIYDLLAYSLLLQRRSVGAQSKLALIERGDVGSDHLVFTSREKAVRKVDLRQDVEHLEGIRTQSHRLDDARQSPL